MKIVPKVFGPLVVRQDQHCELHFNTAVNYQIPISHRQDGRGLSPIDLLLASLGSCLTISMQMAAAELSVNTGRVELKVSATKAVDLPARISHFDAHVIIEESLELSDQERLGERTKSICTVSHTLNAPVVLTIANA